jgi:hypothetical protein
MNLKYNNISENNEDIFLMKDYCLAHCVSTDFHMNKGIALQFKIKYNNIETLRKQNQLIGGLAILEDKNRFLYYLVTKTRYNDKPTLNNMFKSLIKMRNHMINNKMYKLALPRIGCGLDKLKWSEIKQMLQFIFNNTNIKLVICNFNGYEIDKTNSIINKNNKFETYSITIEPQTEKVIKLPIDIIENDPLDENMTIHTNNE